MSRIENIREKTGWTQCQIAEFLGVRQCTVSRWQRKGDELPERTHRLLDLLEQSAAVQTRRKTPRQRA